MSATAEQTAGEAPVTVYRTYDDGFKVRSMRPDDATIVQRWYCGMGIISEYDLNTALQVFPASMRGFYIGEYDGQVVASAVRLPWAVDVCYGSYYYVEAAFRSRGFGTRLRDEVAREHVGDRKLCVDSVKGRVAEINRSKFGYVDASFHTGRFITTAQSNYPAVGIAKQVDILTVDRISFDDLIDFDNKCFISRDFSPRRQFLHRWTQVPGGATYVAVNDGHVIGFGCRRPAVQPGNHQIGPLYADCRDTAAALLCKLCAGVSGDKVTINIWYANEEAVSLLQAMQFNNVFDVLRMHVNGDPHEYKSQVFALTSIDVCGF